MLDKIKQDTFKLNEFGIKLNLVQKILRTEVNNFLRS